MPTMFLVHCFLFSVVVLHIQQTERHALFHPDDPTDRHKVKLSQAFHELNLNGPPEWILFFLWKLCYPVQRKHHNALCFNL